MNLEQLKQEEQELFNLLTANREKQKELNRISFIEKFSADIGDTVEWMDGKKSMKGVISSIEYHGVTPYHYIARLFNSDGNLGKKVKRLYYSAMGTLKIISTNKNK